MYFVLLLFFCSQGANNNRFLLAICASADVEVTFSSAARVYNDKSQRIYFRPASVSRYQQVCTISNKIDLNGICEEILIKKNVIIKDALLKTIFIMRLSILIRFLKAHLKINHLNCTNVHVGRITYKL